MFATLDIIGGIIIPIVLFGLWRARLLDGQAWRLFWLGVLLGFIWEMALHVFGAWLPDRPLFVHIMNWPLAPITMPFVQALWDGLLFLLGVLLIRAVLPGPHFQRFRTAELLLLMGWGVVSALLIEVLAVLSGGWIYLVRPFNPALFAVAGNPITVLPVFGWVVAAAVFYGFALQIAGERSPLREEPVVNR